jgi:hypothetical protein
MTFARSVLCIAGMIICCASALASDHHKVGGVTKLHGTVYYAYDTTSKLDGCPSLVTEDVLYADEYIRSKSPKDFVEVHFSDGSECHYSKSYWFPCAKMEEHESATGWGRSASNVFDKNRRDIENLFDFWKTSSTLDNPRSRIVAGIAMPRDWPLGPILCRDAVAGVSGDPTEPITRQFRCVRCPQQMAQAIQMVPDPISVSSDSPFLDKGLRSPVEYANVYIPFVTNGQQPVTGLHIVATIRHLTGNLTYVNSVTDERGQALLTHIGPLPVSIAVNLAPQPKVIGTNDPEWQVFQPESGLFQLPVDGPGLLARRLRGPRTVVAGLNRSTMQEPSYEYRINAMIVTRNVVELTVTAPAGSKLTLTPPLGAVVVSSEADGNSESMYDGPTQVVSGKLQAKTSPRGLATLQIPVAYLGDGAVPIRVESHEPGGDRASVIQDYPHATVASNLVVAPTPQLIRVGNVHIARHMDVGALREDVVKAYGDLTKDASKGSIVHCRDGADWWDYKSGLCFKMRLSPFEMGKQPLYTVERIRIKDSLAGSIAGVTVGDSAERLHLALGSPEVIRVPVPDGPEPGGTASIGSSGNLETYLNGGLVIRTSPDTIQWIEINRPIALLVHGTTAFTGRRKARFYVNSFVGSDRTLLKSIDDLRRYLGQLPSLTLVDSREDADYILDCGVTDIEERRSKVIDVIPLSYSYSIALSYDLFDVSGQRYVWQHKIATARNGINYTNQAIGSVLVLALMTKSNSDIMKYLTLILGIAGVAELQRVVHNAVNLSPGIATCDAFAEMTSNIDKAVDYRGCVTKIDYERGLLTVKVGTADGIHVSTADHPCMFEIEVAGDLLPSSENGASADYYSAVVVNTDEHSCQCELHHIKRSIRDYSEKHEDAVDISMVRRILDPTTGLVSARASVRFPSLEVLADQTETKNPSNRP